MSTLASLKQRIELFLPLILSSSKLPKASTLGDSSVTTTTTTTTGTLRRNLKRAGSLASPDATKPSRRHGFDHSTLSSTGLFGLDASVPGDDDDDTTNGEDIFDTDWEAPLVLPDDEDPISPLISDDTNKVTPDQQRRYQSFQYYTPLNASLAPLLSEYVTSTQRHQPLGQSSILPEGMYYFVVCSSSRN